MYWIKTPFLVKKWLFPQYIWSGRKIAGQKTVYLTFDDGPTLEITDWVLQQLKEYQAKATFFCIGKNVVAHPTIFREIEKNGHRVGNHTFHHFNGWQTETGDYLQNVADCSNVMDSKLFRPPYGRIKRQQAKALQEEGYQIIMWSVLSGDFDESLPKEKCLENVLANVKDGDIVVFHDSVKAFRLLEYVLPRVLKELKERGFVFEGLWHI
ncbi:MAG: polysaccharide deacetylase family protein [Chitinophagales bacterium]